MDDAGAGEATWTPLDPERAQASAPCSACGIRAQCTAQRPSRAGKARVGRGEGHVVLSQRKRGRGVILGGGIGAARIQEQAMGCPAPAPQGAKRSTPAREKRSAGEQRERIARGEERRGRRARARGARERRGRAQGEGRGAVDSKEEEEEAEAAREQREKGVEEEHTCGAGQESTGRAGGREGEAVKLRNEVRRRGSLDLEAEGKGGNRAPGADREREAERCPVEGHLRGERGE
eukprot:1760771-Rhodomonas_salina.5